MIRPNKIIIMFQYHENHYSTQNYGLFTYVKPGEAIITRNLTSCDRLPVIINNRALDGDIVYYDVIDEGVKVTGIKQRNLVRYVGVLILKGLKLQGHNKRGMPIYDMVTLSWKYPKFSVASSASKKWNDNVYIVAEFKEWLETQKYPHANCINILGDINDPVVQDLSLLYKNDIFLKKHNQDLLPCPNDNDIKGIKAIKAIKAIKTIKTIKAIEEPVKYDNIIVIDPKDSTDFDDGFHIDRVNGLIYVHIADVDSYFKVDGPYEREIQKRLTSIYAHKTYHMLPDSYASDIISLNKRGPKKVITVCFRTPSSDSNDVSFSSIELNSIRVGDQMTYEKAQSLLDHNKHLELKALSDIFKTSDVHKIVENLMVLTNKTIGKILVDNGCAISRYCPAPALARPSALTSTSTQEMKLHKGIAATYSTTEHGHSGLDLEYYTHFTSPIRRYVDILVHRQIKAIIKGALPLSIDYVQEQLNRINSYNVNVKRYYRDRSILDLYNIVMKAEYIETKGYIVGYNNETNNIYIHLPDYNIEYKYPIFHKMLGHIYDVSVSTSTSTSASSSSIAGAILLTLKVINKHTHEVIYISSDTLITVGLTAISGEMHLNRKIIMNLISPKV